MSPNNNSISVTGRSTKNGIAYDFRFTEPRVEVDVAGGGTRIAQEGYYEDFDTSAEKVDGHYALFFSLRTRKESPYGCGSQFALGFPGEHPGEWNSLRNFFGIANSKAEARTRLKSMLRGLVKDQSKGHFDISKQLKEL